MKQCYKVGFVANSDGHKGRPGASGAVHVRGLRRAHVRARRVADPRCGIRRDHIDPSPLRCHLYWVRVTQEDGAQAWTSPVYLDA